MKPISPDMLVLLASRQFYAADIYTITLADGTVLQNGQVQNNGTVLRYCGGDGDISVNSNIYSCGGTTGPYWDRSDNKAKCHWKIGTEVDSLTIDVIPGDATVLGYPFLAACKLGIFDGAEFILEKVFMPVWGDTSRGTVVYFVGRVAEISIARTLATFTINSHLELLNQQLPRNLIQPGCPNTLGDSQCLVDLSKFNVTGVVTSATNYSVTVNLTNSYPGIFKTGPEGQLELGTVPSGTNATYFQAPYQFGSLESTQNSNSCPISGTFNFGTIWFNTGVLAGAQATIKNQVGNKFNLVGYLPNTPNPGDRVTLYYGCDKSSGITLIQEYTGRLMDSTADLIQTTVDGQLVWEPIGFPAGVPNKTDALDLFANCFVSGRDPTNILPGMQVVCLNDASAIPEGAVVLDVFSNSLVNYWMIRTTPEINFSSYAAFGNTGAWTIQVQFTQPASPNGCAKFNNLQHFRGFPFVPQPIIST